jgi:sulfite dehydrogenase (quinone) subunit SoeC
MQTSRQWMVTHEWMLKGNHQSEWIEKRGILLWLAFYTGGLGGGLYLVSLFFDNLWGMFFGWFIVAVLKGSFHLIFLGKPARFWRLLFHPQTSWLSRGLFFVFGFAGFGLLQILGSYFLPDQTTIILVLKIIAGILALCVATYTGFVLNTVKGVPFWNLPILPLLFVSCGILGGFGLMIAIGLASPINMEAAEMGSRIMLLINAFLVFIYLLIASRKDPVGKESVLYQLKGGIAKVFWIGVVSLGIVVPVLVAIYTSIADGGMAAILIFGVCCEILGGMLIRYCMLKSAIYDPIIAANQFNSNRSKV